MFLRKSATVNAHILAFFCLGTHTNVPTHMPHFSGGLDQRTITLKVDSQKIYLWQCLLHSSPSVLDEQRTTFARFTKRETEINEALRNGPIFPWAALTRLQAPKFLSDMVESLLGAVFLDSRGSLDDKLDEVRGVLRTLGLLQVLERIVWSDIDVLHPVSRLSMWASKRNQDLKYDYKKESGKISCGVMLEGEEVPGSRVADQYKGKLTQAEVRLAAAEKAIVLFQLRDVNTSYATLKHRASKKAKSRKRKRSISNL
jgi:dsRNA-specific ribonuclease